MPRWPLSTTVGSSNLDPLSLSLNLEANVFVADRAFAETLGAKLDGLIRHSCKELDQELLKKPSWGGLILGFLAFHVTRFFPRIARQLPAPLPHSRVLSQAKPSLVTVTEKSP